MTAATDTELTEAHDTIRTLTDQLKHARAEVARLKSDARDADAEAYQRGVSAGRYLR